MATSILLFYKNKTEGCDKPYVYYFCFTRWFNLTILKPIHFYF